MRKIPHILLIIFIYSLYSCNNSKIKNKHSNKIDKKVASIISRMTLEEKVGQMMQLNVDLIMKGEIWNLSEPNEVDIEKVKHIISELGTGSILNCGGHTWDRETWYSIHKAIQDVAMETSGIPVLYGVDAIHGVNYTQGATLFPQPLAQAATWNPSLVKKAAEITAYETRASGIPWNFSPVLDLGRQALWSRFFETYGEDVYLAKQMTKACIQGYQGADVSNKEKVAACMKHFLGYSNPFTGKDRTPVYMAERQLREYYLPTFITAIEQGAKTVMINSGELNGIPVHASKEILVDLLRNELHFEGVAVSDWEDIIKLTTLHKVAENEKEATKIAVNSGVDLSMVPTTTKFHTYLVELVKEGAVSEKRINEAVTRILTLKMELGLFENPYFSIADYPKFGSKEYAEVSLNTALEAITLLKNEDEVLPFNKNDKILVTGPSAQSLNILNGAWTHTWQGVDEMYNTKGKLTILEALKNIGQANIQYAPGASLTDEIDIQQTIQKAKNVDKILICLGELPSTEKPGDISNLSLPKAQQDLVKALSSLKKPIILVLVENRPRIINNIEPLSKAILMAYEPSDMGGEAIAQILYGRTNPSGKLPFTYPRDVNDLMLYDHKTTEELDKDFGMNAFKPQFEFGHGLSYTSFTYSNLTIDTLFNLNDTIKISVDVSNTGAIGGKEVVQLYVTDEFASITPSVKRLRGFQKIYLKKGEQKTIQFLLPVHDLSFVGKENQWVVESGTFTAHVSNQRTRFRVQ